MSNSIFKVGDVMMHKDYVNILIVARVIHDCVLVYFRMDGCMMAFSKSEMKNFIKIGRYE